MNKKQVMDIRSSAGMTVAESNEHQRNWNDRKWDSKANVPLANYDQTRAKLNFEVVKGAHGLVVQPIDTSKSIPEKMRESLARRGIADPNENRKCKNIRTLANIIFQGSREQMHQLAFGDQRVDLTKGADNSHISRCRDIEEWAKDMYRFVAQQFGEENIVGFHIHLDEVNPHIHCAVIPVSQDNTISWKQKFGDSRLEGRKIYAALHTELAKVNRKWGLERGADITNTGATHMSTDEYRRKIVTLDSEVSDLEKEKKEFQSEIDALLQEINDLKKKVKSFETMVSNLSKQYDKLTAEIDELQRVIQQSNGDVSSIKALLDEKMSELGNVTQKLQDKKEKLAQAQADLETALLNRRKLMTFNEKLGQQAKERLDMREASAKLQMTSLSNKALCDGFCRLLPTLSPSQLQLFNNTSETPGHTEAPIDFGADMPDLGLSTLAQHTNDIISCAVLLYFGFINEATTYAVSKGGGGGGGGSCKKKDDDDDWKWRRRCLGTATSMMKPRSVKRRR